jgi:hypothetical protein
MLGSDCHHCYMQFFSNCIICLCSDYSLFCLLEGKGKVIFIYAIQANPGAELPVYPWVAFEGLLQAPVAFYLGKKPVTNLDGPLWADYGEGMDIVPLRKRRLRFLRDSTFLELCC